MLVNLVPHNDQPLSDMAPPDSTEPLDYVVILVIYHSISTYYQIYQYDPM
jgi:hypothetical protein